MAGPSGSWAFKLSCFILAPSRGKPIETDGVGRLSSQPTDNVTRLLIELSNGDRGAVDLLLPVIYDELRKLAANYLRRERPDHTLQPTALVRVVNGVADRAKQFEAFRDV